MNTKLPALFHCSPCLYHKNRWPYWCLQYVDSDRKKHDKSTGFRADDPNDTVKPSSVSCEPNRCLRSECLIFSRRELGGVASHHLPQLGVGLRLQVLIAPGHDTQSFHRV